MPDLGFLAGVVVGAALAVSAMTAMVVFAFYVLEDSDA
jgi:hypothetical protein